MERFRRLLALSCALVLFPAVRSSAGDSELKATLEMESASTTPGSTVDIPVMVNGTAPVAGFSFSIDFDETVLEAVSIERLWENSDGSDWSLAVFHVDNSDDDPGASGIAEGFVAGAILFNYEYENPTVYPPPDEDHAIFTIRFLVKPGAPPGATEIRFIDGAKPFPNNPEIPNVVTMEFETAELETIHASLLVDAVLRIIGDITLFIRGDSNGDSLTNVTDAVFTLEYLFLGARAPTCMDAADANDDGKVDITDPVATFAFLFQNRRPLPEPSATPGVDPTDDDLPCAAGS